MKWSRMNREADRSGAIPYVRHVDAHTVNTMQGHLVRAMRLDGIPHEAADDDELTAWHEQLHILMRNIGAPNVALWSHVVRRKVGAYPPGNFTSEFARRLNDRYKAKLARDAMFVNELYLSIVVRPEGLRIGKAPPSEQDEADALKQISEIAQTLRSGLYRYGPKDLGTYTHGKVLFSSLLEHYGYLINGYWQRMPVPIGWINQLLGTSQLLVGREVAHLIGPDSKVMLGALGIKEYHGPVTDKESKVEFTASGQFNYLLSLPFECVVTQSMTFSSREAELTSIKRHQDRMRSSEDAAGSQIEQLTSARDDIASNRYTMGEHHFNLIVKAHSADEMENNIALARTGLAECGIVVARESLGLAGAIHAQLPGNFDWRPRPSSINSGNWVAFSPFHNFPSGRELGNHWGPAVALLKTSSGAPYYFNFHENDLGNTLICGKSGSGKTVLVGFMASMLEKFGARGIFVDKDRGGELAVRALGGQYFALRDGLPTGLNPFGLLPSAANVLHAQRLVRVLAHLPNKPLSVREEKEIDDAVVMVFDLPEQYRRLGALVQLLDQDDADGLAARLRKWIGSGPLAWVFDNPGSGIEFGRLTGFDITEFLDNAEIRLPVMMHLFHRFKEMIDGQRIYMIIDEFWKALGDAYFVASIKDDLKTIRKKNGFLIAATQSPSDALKSDIARTLIEQMPTKILLANPAADYDDYVHGLKMSEAEFDLVRGLHERGRRFVVKQGHHSVVAELNLDGLDDELAILSGTTANVELCELIRARVGDDPKVWEPAFHAARKQGVAAKTYWPEYEEAERAIAAKLRDVVTA